MTPEDFASMTLGEFEAFASRVEVAARTLREAMSFLGASQVGLTQAAPPAQQPAYVPLAGRTMSLDNGHRFPVPPGGLPSFEPQEHLPHLEAKKAERAAFLAQKREDPERAEMLKQFAHDNGAEEEG